LARVAFADVTKVYPGPIVAVEDLTLEAADGEFLIMVGPSGCGKSTALRMVAGLERISRGTIAIGDRVVNDLPPKERDIAMVFQNYALYPHMTVERNLEFGLRQHRTGRDEARRRVAEIAEMLGIEDLLARRPGQLSGGQRQRVAMGRALVRKPAVFLLDEPLSNLDAKLRVEMRAELKRLQARLEVTTIYVTHDQVEAMTLGDRIAVLSGGVLQQVGRPQDVYDDPDNLFVAGFIGSPPMNLFRATVRGGVLEAADLRLPVAHAPDGEIAVGMRPEALHPVGSAHSDTCLEVLVDVVEPLGDEVLVHGTVDAKPVRARLVESPDEAGIRADGEGGRSSVTVRLPPHEHPDPGTRLRVTVAPADVRLFDVDTGMAIRQA
jgi:multiple sugar transport system ATP-binding protein